LLLVTVNKGVTTSLTISLSKNVPSIDSFCNLSANSGSILDESAASSSDTTFCNISWIVFDVLVSGLACLFKLDIPLISFSNSKKCKNAAIALGLDVSLLLIFPDNSS